MISLRIVPLDPTFALGRLVLSRSKQIGFSIIPKNASSSILVSLALAEGLINRSQFETEDAMMQIAHSFTGRLLYKTECEISRVREANIIVRCPFERSISMFLNKFLFDVEDVIIGSVCRALRKDRLDISFSDFISHLEAAPDLWLDPHFRQQSRFFAFKRYTNVFMLGQAQLDDYWLATFGSSLVHANRRHLPKKDVDGAQFLTIRELEGLYTQGYIPSYKSFFSAHLVEKIRLRFEDDFEMIGSEKLEEHLMFPVSLRKRSWI